MEEISELNFWESSVSVHWLLLEASELLAKAVGHIYRRLRPQLLQPVIESCGFVFLNTLTAARPRPLPPEIYLSDAPVFNL